jgi:hypothetical protein
MMRSFAAEVKQKQDHRFLPNLSSWAPSGGHYPKPSLHLKTTKSMSESTKSIIFIDIDGDGYFGCSDGCRVRELCLFPLLGRS